ncbi:MAG: sugar phosphate isomerase/epimerase [Bacteroidia bacterium]|nr:sugar phosphate isomerase/epimerase [Bacteroidia bacterium]
MKLHVLCPHWGQESLPAAAFLGKALAEGYDGIEINLPPDPLFVRDLRRELAALRRERPWVLVSQCIVDPLPGEGLDAFLRRVRGRLEEAASIGPDFINAHSGKDYFSFEDNCRCLDLCRQAAEESGIRVVHETHRGRFSFHAPALLPYLARDPGLELAADYSHFCVVSESLLEGQEDVLAQIAPRVAHLHARVGCAQAPQVADPFAPEWEGHLQRFGQWWQALVRMQAEAGKAAVTLTPECGPAPYMPALPFTRQPIGDAWAINARMMRHLRELLTPNPA